MSITVLTPSGTKHLNHVPISVIRFTNAEVLVKINTFAAYRKISVHVSLVNVAVKTNTVLFRTPCRQLSYKKERRIEDKNWY